MDDKELRKLIREVHEEIKKTKPVDAKSRKVLKKLDKDLRALRDCPENVPVKVDEPVVRNLREARDHFEISHPGLTQNLSKLLTTLSTVGV
jgi:Domain of unknown function (DUF4404)